MNSYQSDKLKFYKKNRAEGTSALNAMRQARYAAKYDPQSRANKLNILPSRYTAYDGEEVTILPNGWKIKVEFRHDDYEDPPWDDCDGVGVIKTGRTHPGDAYNDWILSDRDWYCYYDWKATLPEALRDGWNTKPHHFHSRHEQAMAAMRSTYDRLRRWCNNDWCYVGLIVTLLDEDDTELAEESCWGFESDNIDNLCSEARSWAAHMIREERADRKAEARLTKISNRFSDAMECGV